MLTYEAITEHFLKAAASLSLVTHPEYWMNARTLEREFTCTCHTGSCEEAETRSACTVSFVWGPLDTALSLEGPTGVCDFFHESDPNCLHLHTSAVPPLVLDLSYSLAFNGSGATISEAALLSLIQMLRLRASERSQRTVETRPGISMVLQDNRLRPDTLTLQQRVELPIWHPEGIHGLPGGSYNALRYRPGSDLYDVEGEREEVTADHPHPETWLPKVMVEVCQDIVQVLDALDAALSYHSSDNLS
ncbi:MAG: hypothetical protein IMW89_07810 [Ktedonobacteraceae bacterium]|nr:hypothetical protein [Ktedonobacteraceae bacterium]